MIKSKNKFFLYILFVCTALLLSEFLNAFVDFLSGEDVANHNGIVKWSLQFQIIFGVILSPILETLIFQHYLISFFRKIYVKKPWSIFLPILISASAFSLAHLYSIYYIIDTFIMGTLFAYMYVAFLENFNSKFHAFGVVFICHFILNFKAILI